MKVVRNIKENSAGNLKCESLIDGQWLVLTMPPNSEYEIHESSDWPDIKPCPQSEKDAHALSEAIAQANSQVQAMLDTEAQQRGYDDINSIGKYVGYPNDNQVECEALGAWAAACWTKCKALKAGGVMPSDLLAEMPKLEE